MFLLRVILIIIVLLAVYKFSVKFLIPLITRKLNASPEEAESLLNEASNVIKEADEDVKRALKEVNKKKSKVDKIIKKF